MVAISLPAQIARTCRFTLSVPGQFTVTPPGLQLRAVLGVEGDEILFAASEDPTQTHLWTYRPADGLCRLTS